MGETFEKVSDAVLHFKFSDIERLLRPLNNSNVRQRVDGRHRGNIVPVRDVPVSGTQSLVCSLNSKPISSPTSVLLWNWRNIVERGKTPLEKKKYCSSRGEENENGMSGSNRACALRANMLRLRYRWFWERKYFDSKRKREANGLDFHRPRL